MSGRSRGRARTTQQVPGAAATPGTGETPPQSPLQTPTSPPVPPTPTESQAASSTGEQTSPPQSGKPREQSSPPTPPRPAARVSSPQRPPIPPVSESVIGRGRGIGITSDIGSTTTASAAGTASTLALAAGASSSSGSGSRSGTGAASPGAASSEESPPQQHSPPVIGTGAVGVGRAAIRGSPHQSTTAQRPPAPVDVTGMAQLSIQEEPQQLSFHSVLRTRPATCASSVGTVGAPIQVLCNYFAVLSKPEWRLYQYHVSFSPEIESKRLRLVLLRNHEATLFNNSKAFDGSTLFSSVLLRDDPTEVYSQLQHEQTNVKITFTRTNEILPTSPNFMQLFNVVFRRCLKLYGMKQVGADRNYYDMDRRVPLTQYNIELINGFAASISSYEDNRLLLCAELTHKLLHRTTVFDLMREAFSRDVSSFREVCTSRCVGRTVMTPYNSKTHQIHDINWDASPSTTFEYRGQQISLIDYYKKQYNITIHEANQPLLTVLPTAAQRRRGETRVSLLVPELCILTGVDEAMRNDFRFKKAVDEYTKVGPAERCDRLTKFVSNFNQNPKVREELNRWEMNFQSTPAEIPARVLPAETLMFGQNKVKQLDAKADWSNDIKGHVLTPVHIRDWIIVFPNNKSATAENFAISYAQTIRSMGINANDPHPIPIQRDSPEAYVNALKQNITDKTQIVVCVVSSKRKDRYDAIKRVCCLEIPVPSQVVTTQIIDDERKRRSVVTKVALQMNVKLGGELWATSIPLQDLMICGIDTYHDSDNKKKSVCAFIATSNEAKTRFFSRATLQETHEELSTSYTVTVKSALEHYRRCNGKLPTKLVIYRDGVGDGQLRSVLNSEIPQIQKAFELIDLNYRPLMTFIIVKKRINARFFARSPNGFCNPPCGTVIDTVVTRPEWFDFYLVPQNVSQGTVNPTHFNIIYDTIGLRPEHYQRLSYKLTHMYYNWPGTIRVPAPCQYAHKLAFLIGQSLHREHHQSLCDRLYYL